jgi:hypothetical protein
MVGSIGDTPDREQDYRINSKRSDLFGYVLLAGLAIELIFTFFLDQPLLEKISAAVSNVLIVAGVWGEIHFAKKARIAGDGLQAEANARVAEAYQKAETERTARVALEAKIAPRRLPMEDATALAQELRDKVPPLYIRSLGGSEARQYAQDFFNALFPFGLVEFDDPVAGVPARAPDSRVRLENLGFAMSEATHWRVGVEVYLPPAGTTMFALDADPLVKALRNANVPVGHVWSSDWPAPPLTIPHWKSGRRIIVIGEKPLLRD